MRIHRARPKDATEAVAALQALYHRNPASVSRLAEMLASDQFVLLIATRDASAIGYLQGEVLDRLDGDTMLLVYDLEVAPDSRRAGVGTALMDEALAIASSHDASACWLLTEPDNDAARGLYESLGGETWPVLGYRWTPSEE